MIVKNIFLFVLILVTMGCQREKSQAKNQNSITKNENSKEKLIVDYFDSLRDNSTEIIIKQYKLDNSKNTLQDLSKVTLIKSIINPQKLKQFDKLFDSIKSGGYCCCERTHYKVFFYNKGKEINTYNVDTISDERRVLFFDNSYQTSYLITKEKWNRFLSEK